MRVTCGTISEYQFTPVIVDHHQVNGVAKYHLNPHLFGINGSYELSGAGAAFILAQALGENKDLADLAIVGAVGDLQARRDGKLAGMNREILKIGEEAGVLNSEKDVTFFGKQTRPIYMLLQYSNDPYIPGITGSEQASIGFLQRIGIELKRDDWRRWIDLSLEEKQKIVSNLIQHCLSKGVSQQGIGRLVGEVYTLVREEEGLEMRDASEYSTLLNATARYDFSDVGLAVCMGDREDDSSERILRRMGISNPNAYAFGLGCFAKPPVLSLLIDLQETIENGYMYDLEQLQRLSWLVRNNGCAFYRAVKDGKSYDWFSFYLNDLEMGSAEDVALQYEKISESFGLNPDEYLSEDKVKDVIRTELNYLNLLRLWEQRDYN